MTKGALAILVHGGTENWSPARWKGRFDEVCRDRRVLLLPATGFDPAERAVAAAQEAARKLGVHFKSEIKGMATFDFGERRWDLILLCYVGGREMTDVLQRALKPGGVLIVEGFHRDSTKGRSIGGGVVFDTGELPALYPQLRVVRYEEPVRKADFGQEMVRVVRYCAERPE